ncbi:hypothetical protein [Haloarcula sp. JP-L23]|uniref:hypothetical protein n=1 Tax=Haloarcula sp. JP-L23 TaxID=2716717 RepID=UPI001D03A247
MPQDQHPPSDRRKPLSEAIEHFVADKAKLAGSGNYADMAGRVVRQWADQHADRLEYVDEVEPRHMQSYADYLARRAQARAADPTGEAGITGETAHQYYSLVRAFLTHCQKWEWLTENPAIVERVTDKLPNAHSDRPTPSSSGVLASDRHSATTPTNRPTPPSTPTASTPGPRSGTGRSSTSSRTRAPV